VAAPAAESILTDGLQEVTGMLLEEQPNLSQIFNVVIETIYRSHLGFDRQDQLITQRLNQIELLFTQANAIWLGVVGIDQPQWALVYYQWKNKERSSTKDLLVPIGNVGFYLFI